MGDGEKIGLFLAIGGLAVIAGKASARLARETGIPAIVIGIAAGIVGHGLTGEL
jgi:hypothetical protein